MTQVDDIAQQQGASDNFTGTTYIQSIATEENGPTMVARVTFEKEAHTFWHTHGGEQVLFFLEGKGRVEIEGQGIINAPRRYCSYPATDTALAWCTSR